MKQTNFTKSLKKIAIAAALYFLPFALSAQSADTYKSFINKNGLLVMDAQKAAIAYSAKNTNGQLAKLIQLQSNAVELFNKKEYALAAYTSNLSREAAIQLLKNLKADLGLSYAVSNEEKQLFSSVSPQSAAERTAKQKSSLSTKDEDYLSPGKVAFTAFIQ